MRIGGIDGCKLGWIVIIKNHSEFEYFLIKTIEELHQLFKDQKARFFIDIPIGLLSKEFTRTVDTKLRAELGPRRSTVFNAPCRSAVYESDRVKAKQLNIQVEGKSLSEQTLNIKSKIKEVDQFILEKKDSIELLESHPELCFKYLNDAKIMLSKKSEKTGIEQRLSVLKKYDSAVEDIYLKVLSETKRSIVKKDDILDAICLCLSNTLAHSYQTSVIEDCNDKDQEELPVKIAFFNPAIYNLTKSTD